MKKIYIVRQSCYSFRNGGYEVDDIKAFTTLNKSKKFLSEYAKSFSGYHVVENHPERIELLINDIDEDDDQEVAESTCVLEIIELELL